MKATSKMSKGLATLVMMLFTFMSVQTPVMAAMVTTEQLAFEQQTESQRAALHDFFSRDDVVAQLAERGVDVNAAQDRVGSLTAAEVATLHQQIDDLPAGEGLGLVIGIIVIFMLLDIAGVTDIFPRI